MHELGLSRRIPAVASPPRVGATLRARPWQPLPELADEDVAPAGRDGRDAVELVRREDEHVASLEVVRREVAVRLKGREATALEAVRLARARARGGNRARVEVKGGVRGRRGPEPGSGPGRDPSPADRGVPTRA